VGEDQREQGFLVQSGVRVDQQGVQPQRVDQPTQAQGQPLGVIALAQHTRDLARLDAGGNEKNPPRDGRTQARRHVLRRVLDIAPMPQVVVERGCDRVPGQAKQDVDAW
jgi:hypothetical protein